MCIWKVNEEDRICRYCSYLGGCEVRKLSERPSVDELYEKYRKAMMSVANVDVRTKNRFPEVVCCRYIVVHKLFMDGFDGESIARCVGLNRATVIHGRRNIDFMLDHRGMFKKEINIYDNFIKKI